MFHIAQKPNETTDDSGAVILRAKPEACPERSEGTNKTLHFVQGDTSCQIPHGACPEQNIEILRLRLRMTGRRVRNDISRENLVLILWFNNFLCRRQF